MSKRRGSFLELECKRLLEAEGWLVVKAGGSLGNADLLASRRHGVSEPPTYFPDCAQVLLVQVKGTAAGPFNAFGPKERAELLSDAEKAGGRAVLAWRAPRRKWRWFYGPEDWPNAQRKAA